MVVRTGVASTDQKSCDICILACMSPIVSHTARTLSRMHSATRTHDFPKFTRETCTRFLKTVIQTFFGVISGSYLFASKFIAAELCSLVEGSILKQACMQLSSGK